MEARKVRQDKWGKKSGARKVGREKWGEEIGAKSGVRNGVRKVG